MSTMVTAMAGMSNYGGHLAGGIGHVARWIYQGMTSSLINNTGYLLNAAEKPLRDAFVESNLGGYITGALIKIPVAVMSGAYALDDLRRIRETAGGQSGFYVSREAEDKTAMLSGAAALLSVSSLFRLGNLGRAVTPGFSLPAAITGIGALGLLATRSIYKWVNIDLPFNATSGLAAISFGKPVMRVDNTESAYYMMSHSLEASANARKHEDESHGKAGEGIGRFLEKWMLWLSDFFMGPRNLDSHVSPHSNTHAVPHGSPHGNSHVSPSGDSYSSSEHNSVSFH